MLTPIAAKKLRGGGGGGDPPFFSLGFFNAFGAVSLHHKHMFYGFLSRFYKAKKIKAFRPFLWAVFSKIKPENLKNLTQKIGR
jgi:hypothetical protein